MATDDAGDLLQCPDAWEALVSGEPGGRDPQTFIDRRRPPAGHYVVAATEAGGGDGLAPLTVVGPYPAAPAGLARARAALAGALSRLRAPAPPDGRDLGGRRVDLRIETEVLPTGVPSDAFPDPDGALGGEAARVFMATRSGRAPYTRLGILDAAGLYDLAAAVAAGLRQPGLRRPDYEPASGVMWLARPSADIGAVLASLVRVDLEVYE